jgi:hypothetical protein
MRASEIDRAAGIFLRLSIQIIKREIILQIEPFKNVLFTFINRRSLLVSSQPMLSDLFGDVCTNIGVFSGRLHESLEWEAPWAIKTLANGLESRWGHHTRGVRGSGQKSEIRALPRQLVTPLIICFQGLANNGPF